MSVDLWQRGCERLAAELPEQQFNTWIRPLPPADFSDSDSGAVVSLRVPNRFKLDWIRSQYANRIEGLLSELAGKPIRLELSLAPRDGAGARPGLGLLPRAPEGYHPAPAADWLHKALPMQPGAQRTEAALNGFIGPPHRLNPALTFDTLVAGRANQMARTAALHVAGAPGVMYNPLFVYGGVGLGKTHLVHAVGNALLKDKPHARVQYLHAEQFISDVVKNYQRKTFDELKAKYHSLDLLLIESGAFYHGSGLSGLERLHSALDYQSPVDFETQLN
jgi:chromosomal replication initiator protein